MRFVRDFLRMEAAGGIILMVAALLAVLAANGPAADIYRSTLDARIGFDLGLVAIDKPVLLWINDLLMAVFFLVVGLEIKREMVAGELSDPRRAALPAVAAFGGFAIPALAYLAVAGGDPGTARGWAIPAATDIAFALGILSLLGSRVPVALKTFLLALAIIDDLAAVLVIAFFYTSQITSGYLAGASAAVMLLLVLNRAGVVRLSPYLLVGAVLWYCVLKSGIHATIAGVLTALFVPISVAPGDAGYAEGKSPLERLEHALHPWVAFAIMPIFANAGVSFAGLTWEAVLSPVTMGVALGLFLGKQAGVMAASWLAVRTGLAAPLEGVSWREFYGVALLTGVGFTMSLFIGGLAFSDPLMADPVRLGVITGSLLSGIAGYVWLHRCLPAARPGAQGDGPAA